MKMRNVRLRWPSPAMVVACIALTFALTPASYATISQIIPRNSVGPAQLRDNAVTSNKVRDFSLRAWDFKRGDLPRGPAGPQGPAGVIGNATLRESSTAVPAAAVAGNGLYVTRTVQVRCESGERALSGGTSWSSDANDEELVTIYSRPVMEAGKAVGWRARGGSDIATDRIFTVQVLCAKG